MEASQFSTYLALAPGGNYSKIVPVWIDLVGRFSNSFIIVRCVCVRWMWVGIYVWEYVLGCVGGVCLCLGVCVCMCGGSCVLDHYHGHG